MENYAQKIENVFSNQEQDTLILLISWFKSQLIFGDFNDRHVLLSKKIYIPHLALLPICSRRSARLWPTSYQR